jgi:hypothetical protein
MLDCCCQVCCHQVLLDSSSGGAGSTIFSHFFERGGHASALTVRMTSFPSGPCCLDKSCLAPQHQLRKHCPGCDGWIHMVCGRVLICDEGDFKEDSVVCPRCDPKLQEKRGAGIGASIISLINNLIQPTEQQQISPPTEQQQISPPIEEQQMFQSNEEQQMSPTNEQQMPLPNGQPQEQEQPNTRSRKKRKAPPPTTGRAKKVARVKIKVRKRVKIPRFQLYHILQSDEQRAVIPKDIPNKYLFFGTVVSRGKNKNSWNVKWDALPASDNVVQNITRTKLIVVEDGEEEKPIDDDDKLDEVELNSDKEDESPEKSAKKQHEEAFCKMDRENLKDAESYTMKWGSKESDVVVWKILKDVEYVSLDDDPIILPDSVEFHKDMWNGNEDELKDPTDFFFNYIFPDITGKHHLLADCYLRISFSLFIFFVLSFQGMLK